MSSAAGGDERRRSDLAHCPAISSFILYIHSCAHQQCQTIPFSPPPGGIQQPRRGAQKTPPGPAKAKSQPPGTENGEKPASKREAAQTRNDERVRGTQKVLQRALQRGTPAKGHHLTKPDLLLTKKTIICEDHRVPPSLRKFMKITAKSCTRSKASRMLGCEYSECKVLKIEASCTRQVMAT